MSNNESKLTVIEELIRTKLDYTYTENDLRVARNRVESSFSRLYQQIQSEIFIGEQSGRIIDEFLKEIEKQKKKDFELLDDIRDEINNNLTNLEEQVEQVRKQTLTFYYKNKWD